LTDRSHLAQQAAPLYPAQKIQCAGLGDELYDLRRPTPRRSQVTSVRLAKVGQTFGTLDGIRRLVRHCGEEELQPFLQLALLPDRLQPVVAL
jgi:hypothetical protein